jgi:hypothetical protein
MAAMYASSGCGSGLASPPQSNNLAIVSNRRVSPQKSPNKKGLQVADPKAHHMIASHAAVEMTLTASRPGAHAKMRWMLRLGRPACAD